MNDRLLSKHKKLSTLIKKGSTPQSNEAQTMIHEHHRSQGRFYDLTKESYINFTNLYNTI